jgi:hypothetical protein
LTNDGDHDTERLRRVQRTIALMISIYCRGGHPEAAPVRTCAPDASAAMGADPIVGPVAAVPAAPGLCPACLALAEYSRRRVEQCRFGEDKPTCSHCPVHCFRPEMREQIRVVMRYSGPRMTLRHPYLAVRHLLDARRPGA